MGDEDPRAELAELSAMARQLLSWEETLGGPGFPELPVLSPLGGRSPSPSAATDLPGAGASSASPPSSAQEREGRLRILADDAAACTACELHHSRTRSVFARGGAAAEIAFVGEGPGYHEDQQGSPFVGPAGQLLDKMIAAMGYGPDDVYICNVVKCRPPENRTPHADEAHACTGFLDAQLEVVSPRVIVALGRCASENLGVVEPGGNRWRGVWGDRRGIPVMPTYHPAFLLRSPQFKRPVWEDLKKVMALLGRSGG